MRGHKKKRYTCTKGQEAVLLKNLGSAMQAGNLSLAGLMMPINKPKSLFRQCKELRALSSIRL